MYKLEFSHKQLWNMACHIALPAQNSGCTVLNSRFHGLYNLMNLMNLACHIVAQWLLDNE